MNFGVHLYHFGNPAGVVIQNTKPDVGLACPTTKLASNTSVPLDRVAFWYLYVIVQEIASPS